MYELYNIMLPFDLEDCDCPKSLGRATRGKINLTKENGYVEPGVRTTATEKYLNLNTITIIEPSLYDRF